MISPRASRWICVAILALAVSPIPLASGAAEEITLQNGQKVVGTIVGYENEMFRVETEFGFALVRKDRVRSISFKPGTTKDTGRKSATRESTPVVVTASEAGANPAPSGATKAEPPSAPAASIAAPPPVSKPLNIPLPADLREHVEGTNYINDTFQFTMYKPPGWKIHEGVPQETGRAIVAMGPEDEQTLLIVDRQVWSGAPDLKRGGTETGLRHTYENYQVLSESAVQVDGRPGFRRDFKGLMDGAEWHGMSVRVAEGNTVFGITGLTSSEMTQFQQAVLNKIISSFRFLSNKAPAPVARQGSGQP